MSADWKSMDWGELLAALRRDLQLDPGTDLGGSVLVRTGEQIGAGSATLGANCPAVTAAAPYTWERVATIDGSTAFIPAWK